MGFPFSGAPFAFSLQGTDTVDYKDDELCGVRILVTQPSQSGDGDRYKSTVGERVVILGEISVRKVEPGARQDTSFKVRFPASTPYLMQGIDCLGRTLNTDQTWRHLKPGEVKTCNGCHVHGKNGLPFARSVAASPTYRALRLGEGTVPLLTGTTSSGAEVSRRPGYGLQFEYIRDVFPILQQRCASCHSGAGAMAGLHLDRPGTGPGSTYDRLVLDGGQKFVPAGRRYPHAIRKPQLTKYVRALTARGSLLYWKAANQRTDGRTDRTYTALSGPGREDVDFGPAHPTAMTPDELGILSRWLDTGAAAEAGFLLDTTPPALHLAGVGDGSSLSTLHVGTVDVASGIRAESLEVCVAGRDGRCGPNLAPRAEPHGVVAIQLFPVLSDPDLEIRARVRDQAGNLTEERRTVRWLLEVARTASGRSPALTGSKAGSR